MKNIYGSLLCAGFIFLLVIGCAQSSSKDKSESNYQVTIVRTTLDQTKLLEEKNQVIADAAADELPLIQINPDSTYQEIDGFGYTLTGGSAMHLASMNPQARHEVLKELFSPEGNGIGVSYLRISIGASDLDEAPFSYHDVEKGAEDLQLKQFDLGYDKKNLIPLLQEIISIYPAVKILGSPWSPPSWMKSNKDTRGGSLLPQYYQTYAHYLVKYVKAMENNGIPIDAITVQNEPLHPGNNPSLFMPATAQAEFIKGYLGPAFRNAALKTKIIIYDHNADRPDYPISILNDSVANQYIDGSAFHLYGGEIEALSEVHKAHPDKNLYFTEQWIGAPGDFPTNLSWHTRELIIGATRNWSRTVLEWNLAADENQDPHTDRGGCDRCLGAITVKGNKIERNPAYYIIGHASKYVRPGSKRIKSNKIEGVPNVAFKTPKGQTVVILLNDQEKAQKVALQQNEKHLSVELSAGEVMTIVI